MVGLPGIHIETKRVEKLNIYDAIKQAVRDAREGLLVKLFQRIYGEHGYYCEWSGDIAFLFARQNGLSNGEANNLINDVVGAAIRRGIFDKRLFDKYGILTSKGIQKRYLDAVYKRKEV